VPYKGGLSVKTSKLSEFDLYLFHQGTNYHAYEMLGAHFETKGESSGVRFALWAPHAKSVSVVGDFNNWDTRVNPMERIGDGEIWQVFIEGLSQGDIYKYAIEPQWGGPHIMKADPYGFYAEKKPKTASRLYRMDQYAWQDGEWQARQRETSSYGRPMLTYEVHMGSWRRTPEGEYLTYREAADQLIAYVKDMNYTHIEFMPLCEHPFDGSWGYQVTGYYAPTARYGEPTDFMYLVNTLHKAGIGVILDWVPAHFCPDAHGLARFDGECIFEDPDPRRGEHPDWGTKIFNLGKHEVSNFLIANVLYWIREYHIDGIRVDAVASMLYLNYGKQDGQWVPNIYGGKENLDAIEFFKHMNSVVHGAYPGFMTIAEESTAWPRITGKVEDDGLGFSFKWNMGWMHDFCEYMKLDPIMRSGNHNALTFAMSYNNAENYILPLSHDEVVHLKCSMVEKMPGYKVDKYANLRVGYTFMMGHCGKKLLFMGQEFGQEREWSEARELDWFLLQNDLNAGMQKYVGDLLKIYRTHKCLYEIDNDWGGFEWINANDASRSIYSFFRKSTDGKKWLLFVLNMTPMKYDNFRIGVPSKKQFKLLLNSALKEYGGHGDTDIPEKLKPQKGLCDYRGQYLEFHLPAYGALVFEFNA
jgi:1,4-alpha-glucan branching enzyme